MKSLDKLDLKILNCLQADARITNQALAEKVNLSPSSCLQRVRRLEESHYIEHYLAKVNLSQVCRYVTCIATVTMRGPGQQDYEDFVNIVKDIPQVIECSTVSGQFDFFIKIVCEDMNKYLELNNYLLNTCKKIENIKTYVVMNENKQFEGYDLDALAPIN